MDAAVPPQLARIASLGMDAAGIKRNTLTPILNREEAIREWERRRAGHAPPASSYPQLEYLQQQAELTSGNWTGPSTNHPRRYAPHQPSSLQFQSPPSAVVSDSSRHLMEKNTGPLRDITLSSSRTTAAGDSYEPNSQHHTLPNAPPQVYNTNSVPNRYATNSSSYTSPQTQNAAYDSYDHRDGMGTLYAPLQPNVLSSQAQQQLPPSSSNSNGNPLIATASSFYSGRVGVPNQQQSIYGQQSIQQNQQSPLNPPPQVHQVDMWSR